MILITGIYNGLSQSLQLSVVFCSILPALLRGTYNTPCMIPDAGIEGVQVAPIRRFFKLWPLVRKSMPFC